MTELSSIVKAYDVRGLVGSQINVPVARAIGAGFVQTLAATGDDASRIVIGYDMRESSPVLAEAFADGAFAAGAEVVMAGLGSTDQLYYASGALNLPGAMFTASHNPATYNGIKMCRSGAKPIGLDTGLADIRDRAQVILDGGGDLPDLVAQPEQRDLLADYAGYLRELVDLSGIRPLKVVVDAGNGMAGFTVPAVLGDTLLPTLPLNIVPLFFELDGSFPNHEANPLEPANIVDLQQAVVQGGADLGLAFDGDADRCFVVDEHGDPVSPSAITALVAVRELRRHPGGTIIHNLITSTAVAELVIEHGGHPIRSRVGHSFIKAEMARTGAVFGGEHSAHYYFKDFWGADTGMLAAMHVLAELGHSDQPLSTLGAQYERYVASGEINTTVTDQSGKMTAVESAYADQPGVAAVDHLDGLTVRFDHGGWINVRPSNTEPLLRLNVEAPDRDTMVALRDGALAIIRG